MVKCKICPYTISKPFYNQIFNSLTSLDSLTYDQVYTILGVFAIVTKPNFEKEVMKKDIIKSYTLEFLRLICTQV